MKIPALTENAWVVELLGHSPGRRTQLSLARVSPENSGSN
jgi:hypothetical protein